MSAGTDISVTMKACHLLISQGIWTGQERSDHHKCFTPATRLSVVVFSFTHTQVSLGRRDLGYCLVTRRNNSASGQLNKEQHKFLFFSLSFLL